MQCNILESVSTIVLVLVADIWYSLLIVLIISVSATLEQVLFALVLISPN